MDFKTKIAEMKDWLIEIRRTIHMYPELGFEEVKTSQLVAQWLEKFGLEVKTGIAQTGVVGLLKGAKPGKTVAIRADMDALPIEEANDIPYRSQIKGKMHACGHDAHTTILLGVARFFSSLGEQIKGNIKWIFQPAEEGGGGGKVMADAGVLENPKVDAIFGAHVYPDLNIGQVGIHEREGLAATDRFIIKLLGKGGHGAYPHLCKDPILAAGHMITQIHSIVSRNVPPLESAVITIGKISGGSAFNIIPDDVELIGTVRSLTPQVREILKNRLEEEVQGIARSFDIDYKFTFNYGYPALINDPTMSRLVADVCVRGFGKNSVVYVKPSMGGEDFAYYLQKVPGAFFRLGVRNEQKGIVQTFHNANFNIDEDVLPFGVEVFVRIINEFLELKFVP
ncbi:MAG: M20 metallopeptidase family protein [Thermodesulfobacteriota bacterium]